MFVTVAKADEVAPGTARRVQAGDRALALVRIGDEFYATDGACRHLHGPLGEGRIDDHVLTCPWHGWQYDVRTGLNVFDHAIRVETFEVRVEGGDVKVALP